MALNHYYIWSLIHLLKQWYGYKNISTAVIFAQAKHETGNFTSAIFKENNNLFGMQVPSSRKNYVTGKNRGHATFKSLFDSVRDYFLRQKEFRIPSTSDDEYMIRTNNSGYAEDMSYYKKWKSVLSGVKAPFPKWLGLLLILIGILLLAYILDKSGMWNRNKNAKKFNINHG